VAAKESNGTNMHSTVRPARHPHESKCSCHRQALLSTHCKLLLVSLVHVESSQASCRSFGGTSPSASRKQQVDLDERLHTHALRNPQHIT
jgi:hypothetical protein